MASVKVMVGMSGGVDSSVAALLLLKQGYDVAGATSLLWDDAIKVVDDAKIVCEHLGIPHHIFDYRKLFRETVIDPFASEYQSGKTPNPCVFCNRSIKFGAFIRDSAALGYDMVSTGHYVRVEKDPATGLNRLRRGSSLKKDQSYVFYTLKQEQIQSIITPLGELDKPEVRLIAEQSGMPVAHKSDSQDICFIPDGDYAAFLERHTGGNCPPGNFIDESGEILGRHGGIWRYTIGQRKGLGVGFGKPVYVQKLDAESNTITLGPNETLFKRELTASNINWTTPEQPGLPIRIQAKIRYSHTPANALVELLDGNMARVVFDEPQRAITAGQAVVFYDGEYLIGGGTIV